MDVQDDTQNVGGGADDRQGLEQNTPAPTDEEAKTRGAKVKTLLAALSEQDKLHLNSYEKEVVYGMLHSSGNGMYGVGAVSVYVFYSSRLIPLGTWIDPDILSNAPEKERENMLHPEDAYPNVGLVGALWSDKSSMMHSNKTNKTPRANKKSKHGLHWKTLSSVIDDPDQSKSHRVETMRSAGLEKATGVKFYVSGIRGMTVYYAENGVDNKILTDPAMETYLCRVSYMKGTLLSVIEARRRTMEIVPDSRDLVQNDTDATSLESPMMMAHELRSNLRIHTLRRHVTAWLRKTTGAGAQIPACFSWKESLWTAIGTFVGLCVIAILNRTFLLISEEEYFLVLGPFGALMTLQYGLIGSPAGQPRTVMIGHAIAGSIALGLTYIPEERLAIGWRQILSVTFANFAMVKLGVACPPASAHSLIYAEGKHDWKFWGLALLGCLLSFIPAIFFNNLNPRRQYPSFWGYAPVRVYNHLIQETKEKYEEGNESDGSNRTANGKRNWRQYKGDTSSRRF